MKLLKLITLMLTAACLALALSSCGDEEPPPSEHYETVLDTMTAAVKAEDEDTYLRCFTPAARDSFSLSRSKDSNVTDKLHNSKGDSALPLVYETLEHREIDISGIKNLQRQYTEKYARRLDIVKAYELKVEFSSGESSATRMITVFNNGNDWYILGDVIDKLF